MRRLAVIPARGGSTRLVDKNVHPLGGKPLIQWSVENVVKSGCFDDVYVSTDSEKIWDAVKHFPVKRHNRPEEHATVTATVLKAMISLMGEIEERGDKYDTFAYFLPTCPLVPVSAIREGVEKLTEGTDSVICMTEYNETIQLACIVKEGNVTPIFDNLTSGLTNSKFIQKYHRPTGAFYMGMWDSILKNQNFFKGNVKGVVIPNNLAADINDIYDIQLAENTLQRLAGTYVNE